MQVNKYSGSLSMYFVDFLDERRQCSSDICWVMGQQYEYRKYKYSKNRTAEEIENEVFENSVIKVFGFSS